MTGVRDKPLRLSDEQRLEIVQLRSQGWKTADLAKRFQVHKTTIYSVAPVSRSVGHHTCVDRDASTCAQQRPKHDTRNLTGLLCGDPLPGRSALDRRGDA